MKTNIAYISQNQAPRPRTYRIPYDNFIESPNAEQFFKEPLNAKQLTKKNTQSNKQITFHRVQKIDSQNQESIQQKLQRERKKIRAYFENELNEQKRLILQSDARLRGVQKERNNWKQAYINLKNDYDKIIVKNNSLLKNSHQVFYDQQNNSYKANKGLEEEASKLKNINSQMAAQLSKLRQQNKKLQNHITKLESQIVCNGIVRVDGNRKHEEAIIKNSPLEIHREKSSQSPHRSHPSRSASPARLEHHLTQHSPRNKSRQHNVNENSLSMNDPNKEIEKLRKICGKMEKILAERNEDIMKQKSKFLNSKYRNYV